MSRFFNLNEKTLIITLVLGGKYQRKIDKYIILSIFLEQLSMWAIENFLNGKS